MAADKKLKRVLPVSMLSYFFTACWSFLVPLIQKDLGFTFYQIGLVVGVSTLGSIAARLGLGRIADRFDAGIVMRLSLLALSASVFGVFLSFDILSFTLSSTLYLLSTAMIYWTSMLVIDGRRHGVATWLSLNSFAAFLGFIFSTAISTFLQSRLVFGATFFVPLLFLGIGDLEASRKNFSDGGVDLKLLVLSAAGFFMVFHVNIWSNFLPIYLENTLPNLGALVSTGAFLALDSLLFSIFFYLSGKVEIGVRGAAMVAATTLVFTSIVSAVPALPLTLFLVAFLVARNIVICFRMIGVAEMVKDKGLTHFQTQFYSTAASTASIIAPVVGGLMSDSMGLGSVFMLSAPFGVLASALFMV